MKQEHLSYLLALHRERDWGQAARACRVSQAELVQGVRAAEREYGHALVTAGDALPGLTAQGEKVVAVASLLQRRSVSPKRLGAPAPDAADIELMIDASLSAPDHGGLHPWRFVVFPTAQRERLADLFEQEKLRRDPLASREDVKRAREHATRSPALLAFIVSPKARMRVPLREQLLAAGAALGNFLNAAHRLGFGAIVLSGERCFDPILAAQLGVGPSESLAGFISLGSILAAPAPRKPVERETVRSVWSPGAPPDAATPGAADQEAPIGQPAGWHRG